jgi:hypothetical protein
MEPKPNSLTLGGLLDQGVKLIPIADSPFTNPAWRIGFFWDGVPHAAFRDRFRSQKECQTAIQQLLEVEVQIDG